MSTLTLFFTSSDKMAQYAKELPNPKIGCSTAGEINLGMTSGLSQFELNDKHFQYEVIPVKKTAIPIIHAEEIKQAVEGLKRHNKHLLCIVFNDGLAGHEEIMQTTLKALLPSGTPIIGGSTGDDLRFTTTLCCFNDELFKGSLILLLGTNLSYYIHKENIYVPTEQSLIVTEAIDRTVYTFDNIKASKRYAQLLNVDEHRISDYFAENPLGKVNGNEIYIASPQKVNPDGSITFYCKMLPSTFLKLLTGADLRSQFDRTVKAINKSGKPLITMTSSCILRKLKFEHDHAEPLVNEHLKQIKAVGFTTYGEQLDGLHINQTMVTLTFYEG